MRILFLSIIFQLLSFFTSNNSSNEFSKDVHLGRVTVQEELNAYLKDTRYESMLVLIPKSEELKELSPILGKGFLGFKEAIGFRESSSNYFKKNSLGYIGKYQFGGAAMSDIGISNKKEFLRSPELQERAFVALCSLNKYKLRKYLKYYNGKTIGGVKLTESGMLAAAHLVGPGAVMDFIKSSGRVKASDAYGTDIVEYLNSFGGYDTSVITPARRVAVKIS